MKGVVTRSAYSDGLHYLEAWDLHLILTTGTAKDFATMATMMAPFIQSKLDATVDTGAGIFILHPVVDKAPGLGGH